MNTDEIIEAITSAGMSIDFTAKTGIWIWHFPDNGCAKYVQAYTLREVFFMAMEKGWLNLNG